MGKTIITIVAELLVALAFLVGRISGERQSIPAPVALESPAPLTLEALSQQEALTGEAVRQEEKISAPASSKATAIPNAPSTTEIKKEISPPTTFLVTRVIDGDTVELENGERVRYIGIDTPESVDPRKPVECFGKEAAKENEKLAHRDCFSNLYHKLLKISNIFSSLKLKTC